MDTRGRCVPVDEQGSPMAKAGDLAQSLAIRLPHRTPRMVAILAAQASVHKLKSVTSQPVYKNSSTVPISLISMLQ